MPRSARIDAPGALHHIICRGIERRKIFLDDSDRNEFIDRLSTIVNETSTPVYAWALIPNHFHLLLRTGKVPISIVMRRLLTGYALFFNGRHRRSGRLFQNRYKSILCQEQTYLLELVRYIHLNPLRAGIIQDLKALDKYSYSGHSHLMGKKPNQWQDANKVLGLFGTRKGAAKTKYRKFIEAGALDGRRPEFTGGGLIRSSGGWGVLKTMRKMKQHLKGDERILGDSDFVESVLRQAQEDFEHHYRLIASGYTLDTIIDRVADIFELTPKLIISSSKEPTRVRARSVAAYWAVNHLQMQGTEVGRSLSLTQSAVSRAVRRGEQIADEMGITLLDKTNA